MRLAFLERRVGRSTILRGSIATSSATALTADARRASMTSTVTPAAPEKRTAVTMPPALRTLVTKNVPVVSTKTLPVAPPKTLPTATVVSKTPEVFVDQRAGVVEDTKPVVPSVDEYVDPVAEESVQTGVAKDPLVANEVKLWFGVPSTWWFAAAGLGVGLVGARILRIR